MQGIYIYIRMNKQKIDPKQEEMNKQCPKN
jgi:hypothetical protein